jgi:glycine cleavage system H protein
VTVPTDLHYTSDQEWISLDGNEATVGITQYAADQLGDIVFVELPDIGRALESGKAFGVVESVKAVSDLFAPLGGTVTAINDALADGPELVNADPYGEGWMIRMTVPEGTNLSDLLDAASYDAIVAAG